MTQLEPDDTLSGKVASRDAPVFMGLPVTGDYDPEKVCVQRTLDELRTIVQSVLQDPGVDSFGWRQYTPYFNDGEPCEFTATGFWAKPATDQQVPAYCDNCGTDQDPVVLGDPENCWCDNEDSYGFPGYHDDPPFGKRDYRWENSTRIDLGYSGPDEARYDRLQALCSAIEGGQFYDVLRSQFGNHVKIVVTKESVELTTYEHD